ncbi:polyadenylate-binding protein 1-like [Tachysurus fulvidraco]|uniref:polyadenylate-binding protein 1-like n=1 Tax=Tachysurus fulvidraco TaxID=1234273 RepID=UPI001FEE202D|nr:polyadenylate-binding protein 1-like [Tachysurus fulvidraco]
MGAGQSPADACETQEAPQGTTVKLLLRNLDCNVDDGRLHEEFHPFGTVINVQIIVENGRPKDTGFDTFASADEARNAIIKMKAAGHCT